MKFKSRADFALALLAMLFWWSTAAAAVVAAVKFNHFGLSMLSLAALAAAVMVTLAVVFECLENRQNANQVPPLVRQSRR